MSQETLTIVLTDAQRDMHESLSTEELVDYCCSTHELPFWFSLEAALEHITSSRYLGYGIHDQSNMLITHLARLVAETRISPNQAWDAFSKPEMVINPMVTDSDWFWAGIAEVFCAKVPHAEPCYVQKSLVDDVLSHAHKLLPGHHEFQFLHVMHQVNALVKFTSSVPGADPYQIVDLIVDLLSREWAYSRIGLRTSPGAKSPESISSVIVALGMVVDSPSRMRLTRLITDHGEDVDRCLLVSILNAVYVKWPGDTEEAIRSLLMNALAHSLARSVINEIKVGRDDPWGIGIMGDRMISGICRPANNPQKMYDDLWKIFTHAIQIVAQSDNPEHGLIELSWSVALWAGSSLESRTILNHHPNLELWDGIFKVLISGSFKLAASEFLAQCVRLPISDVRLHTIKAGVVALVCKDVPVTGSDIIALYRVWNSLSHGYGDTALRARLVEVIEGMFSCADPNADDESLVDGMLYSMLRDSHTSIAFRSPEETKLLDDLTDRLISLIPNGQSAYRRIVREIGRA